VAAQCSLQSHGSGSLEPNDAQLHLSATRAIPVGETMETSPKGPSAKFNITGKKKTASTHPMIDE